MDYVPAVFASGANEFALAITHGGWSNPAGLPRSTQQRSVYLLDDGKLFRVYYSVLDPTYSSDGISTQILDGVESLEFRFMPDAGDSINQWPPDNSTSAPSPMLRPRAVEVVITLEDEGEIRRIIEVAS